MVNGQDWMTEEHARAGVAHHDPDALSQFRPVAVYWAFGAGRFPLLKGALVQAFEGILEEFLALWTEHTR